MAAEDSSVLHLEHKTLRVLVIDSNILVLACGGKEIAVGVVVDGVELVRWVVLAVSCMEASSTGGMPVLQESIGLCADEHVGGLEIRCLWSPSQRSDWHVIRLAILIDVAAQSKSTLGRLRIVDANGTISKSTGKILVGWVEPAGEHFGIRVA